MKTKHTPVKISIAEYGTIFIIDEKEQRAVLHKSCKDFAEFIVKSCNHHEELVLVLKRCLKIFNDNGMEMAIKSNDIINLIAKAEGK